MPYVRFLRSINNQVAFRATGRTDDYRASRADDVILADATAGDVSITLPAYSGHVLNVKRTDASSNQVTVTPESGTIDGQASWTLSQYECLTMLSDGSDWWIL